MLRTGRPPQGKNGLSGKCAHECAAAAPERSYDLRMPTTHEGLKYLKDAAVGEQGARCMDAVFPWSQGLRGFGQQFRV